MQLLLRADGVSYLPLMTYSWQAFASLGNKENSLYYAILEQSLLSSEPSMHVEKRHTCGGGGPDYFVSRRGNDLHEAFTG